MSDVAEAIAALGLPEPIAEPVCLPGGAWASVWRVDLPDGPAVLRVLPPGAAQTCHREVAVMRAALAGGVPVPAVRAVGDVAGRSVVVMDWCPGRTVAAEAAADPSRAHHLGVLSGRALARIHAVAAPEVLSGGWIDAGGSDPAALSIAAHLRSMPLRTDALIHLDFHPLNVLTDGRRITGVVDWTNAAAGDPWADVARTVSLLRLDAARPDVLPRAVQDVLPTYEAGLLDGYAEALGAAPADLAPLHAWAGAAMLRDLAGRRSDAFFAQVRAYRDTWAERAGILRSGR